MGRRRWTGPGWPDRSDPLFMDWANAPPSPSIFQRMGRGPARPINFTEDGPRPGPAHQLYRGLAAARPGPSTLQRMGSGRARPINFQLFQPGPVHDILDVSGRARPGSAHDMSPIKHGLYSYGLGRHLCGSVREFERPPFLCQPRALKYAHRRCGYLFLNCYLLIIILLILPGELRRGGLTPACGSTHARKTGSKRSGQGPTVEATNYCQGLRCGIESVYGVANMRWSECGGGLYILKGESNGTVGRTRSP